MVWGIIKRQSSVFFPFFLQSVTLVAKTHSFGICSGGRLPTSTALSFECRVFGLRGPLGRVFGRRFFGKKPGCLHPNSWCGRSQAIRAGPWDMAFWMLLMSTNFSQLNEAEKTADLLAREVLEMDPKNPHAGS